MKKKHLDKLSILALGCGILTFASSTAKAKDNTQVSLLDKPATGNNSLYAGNRAPLLPSAFVKLPIGAIQAQGWLHTQLQIMADGFPGHLPEVSHWAKFEGNAWTSPAGEGANGWEEVPYWLRGYGDLGYVLGDARIKADFKRWIDAILASQQPDGYFGPQDNKKNYDIWPNMLALYALRTYYEATADGRVLPFMTKYFKWQSSVPQDKFLPGSWQKVRGGDNLDSIYWLYNQTSEQWLLDLATFNHQRTSDWTKGIASRHGVDLAQSFREPATYYQQAHDFKYLQATLRDYNEYWGTWGQVPGGMYGADENARPGYTGPRQAAETCAMVEAMFSHEILEGITGDPIWADRTEDVAFNSLPAAMTPDGKGLHYLTSPNMVQLDSKNKAPGLQNGGTMISYDPGEVYRCCQHNAVMGWPYFTEHLWMATPDNGLAAVLYAPNTVNAKVGDGTPVQIVQTTNYPFSEQITFNFTTPKAVSFPLMLRVPGWCPNPNVRINGRKVSVPASGANGGWIRLARTWQTGDRVNLTLPMTVRAKVWEQNRNAVSIYRGPLAYSLKIGERSQRYGGTDKWPAFEIYPTTPWNYGLLVNLNKPASSFHVVQRKDAMAAQPFTPETTPIMLIGKGQRIPQWQQDDNGLIEELQPGPVRSDQVAEQITLVPMGAARLRISAFPQIGNGSDAKTWVGKDRSTKFTYSFLNGTDAPLSVSDVTVPKNSADKDMPRFTWWDHKGTQEWVQYEFKTPRRVSSCDVYWYDDTGHGGVRIPDAWQIMWWDGNGWQPVQHPVGHGVKSASAPYAAEIDKFNHIAFNPVQTTRLRLVVQLQKDYSGGILAWHVGG